jgi:hypothetical protein
MDYWALIYNNHEILGFTPTYQEAEEICKKNNKYTWEFARYIYKSKDERDKIIKSLTQITINDS